MQPTKTPNSPSNPSALPSYDVLFQTNPDQSREQATRVLEENRKNLEQSFELFQQTMQKQQSADPMEIDNSVVLVSDQTMISPTPDMLNAAGVTERNNRNYQEALKLFQQAAEKKHPEAMYQIGMFYHHGLGVAKDAVQALTWMWKAERLGFECAQFFLSENLENRYWNARDWQQDEVLSRDQLVALAESGDVVAMNKLGMLEQSAGQNQAALEWYQKAADRDDPIGMSNLGFMKDSKEETPQWYKKAAQKGNHYALFRLGFYEMDEEKQQEYLKQAAQLGYAPAIEKLADQLIVAKQQFGQLDQESQALLDKYYARLFDLGDVEGASDIEEDTSISVDEQERQYQRAANLNNSNAVEWFASKYRDDPRRPIEEKLYWYRRMIDMNNPCGSEALRSWYKKGALSKNDSVKLLDELKGAVEQGSAYAFFELATCVSTPEDIRGIKMRVSTFDLNVKAIDTEPQAKALAELLSTDTNIVSLQLEIKQEWIPVLIPALKINNTLKNLHLKTNDTNANGKVYLTSNVELMKQLESIQACSCLMITTDDDAANNYLEATREIAVARVAWLEKQAYELIFCAKELPYELIQTIVQKMANKSQPPEIEIYLLGMSKRQKGLYAQAITCFFKVDMHKYPAAQYQLGLMCFHGLGVEKNTQQAMLYFRQALDGGFAPANRMLSIEFKNTHWNRQGLSETTDVNELSKQAESGDVVAMNELGILFQNNAVASAARDYYYKAAIKGDPAGMSNYGHALQYGLGVSVAIDEARTWYEKAAALGNVYATYRLGALAYQEKKYEEAHQWLEQADALNTPRFSAAADVLGECYKHGKGVARNLEKALEWYEKAAKLGSSNAYLQIARIHLELKNIPKAHENYKIAADLGEREALFELANINWEEKSYTLALENYHLAADLAHPYAFKKLARIYRTGWQEIAQDQQKADHYRQRALEYGSPTDFVEFVADAKQPDDI